MDTAFVSKPENPFADAQAAIGTVNNAFYTLKPELAPMTADMLAASITWGNKLVETTKAEYSKGATVCVNGEKLQCSNETPVGFNSAPGMHLAAEYSRGLAKSYLKYDKYPTDTFYFPFPYWYVDCTILTNRVGGFWPF